ASLRSLLSPPSDSEERVADQVSQQLIDGSAAGTALDLLGLGVRTFMMFLSEDPSAADRDRERPEDGPNRDEQDRRATAWPTGSGRWSPCAAGSSRANAAAGPSPPPVVARTERSRRAAPLGPSGRSCSGASPPSGWSSPSGRSTSRRSRT